MNENQDQKIVKYSKKKIFMSGLIGAIIGIATYIIYENLDQETKESFTKQITKSLKNLLNNVINNE